MVALVVVCSKLVHSSKTWIAKYFRHAVGCTWDCLLTDYNTFLSWSTGLQVSSVHVYTVLSVRERICKKKGSGDSLKVRLGRIRLTVAIRIDVSTRWMKTMPITAH